MLKGKKKQQKKNKKKNERITWMELFILNLGRYTVIPYCVYDDDLTANCKILSKKILIAELISACHLFGLLCK